MDLKLGRVVIENKTLGLDGVNNNAKTFRKPDCEAK